MYDIIWPIFNNIFYFLLVISFVVIVFLIKNNFFKKESITKKNTEEVKHYPIEFYINEIKNIEKNYINEESEVFYRKLSDILFVYFEDKKNIKVSKKTLKEMKKTIDKWVLNIFEKIYYPKYSNELDNFENRKKIIQNILKSIKSNDK